jgi:hypothetical protein
MRLVLLLSGLFTSLPLAGCRPMPLPLTGSLRPAAGVVSLTAPPALARVVFVRKGQFYARDFTAKIFDTASRQVWGRSLDDSTFAVNVEPGSYELCPLPVFADQSPNPRAKRTQVRDLEASWVKAPVTHVELAAGKTYLFSVQVPWGGRLEVMPVTHDSALEAEVLDLLPRTRQAEVTTVETVDDDDLARFEQLCRLPSALRMEAAEGR